MYTMHVESKHFICIGTYPFQAPETLGHTTYTKVGTIFHASTIYLSTFFGTTTIPPLYTNNFFYFLHIMHLNSSATHLQGSTRLRIYPTVFFREKPSFQFQGCRKNLPGFSHVCRYRKRLNF